MVSDFMREFNGVAYKVAERNGWLMERAINHTAAVVAVLYKKKEETI